MTPFAAFILVDASLLGLLVCSLIWVFKNSAGRLWLKFALAIAFGVLACWSPLATRAILGYPQPETLSELPNRFQLLAEHSVDDHAFDLWIATAEQPTPLAVTVTPDKNMRSVLRAAQQKLGQGEAVFVTRGSKDGAAPTDAHAGEAPEGDAGHGGNPRTHFADDQTRWELLVPSAQWRKDSGQ